MGTQGKLNEENLLPESVLTYASPLVGETTVLSSVIQVTRPTENVTTQQGTIKSFKQYTFLHSDNLEIPYLLDFVFEMKKKEISNELMYLFLDSVIETVLDRPTAKQKTAHLY